MEDETQRATSTHLQELAAAELATAARQVAEAGATIEGLRADAVALAVRVDGARAEVEQFRQEREDAVAELAEKNAENERLQDLVEQLEAHITRLKQQLSNPGKLVVKKALRRGQYAKPGDA